MLVPFRVRQRPSALSPEGNSGEAGEGCAHPPSLCAHTHSCTLTPPNRRHRSPSPHCDCPSPFPRLHLLGCPHLTWTTFMPNLWELG